MIITNHSEREYIFRTFIVRPGVNNLPESFEPSRGEQRTLDKLFASRVLSQGAPPPPAAPPVFAPPPAPPAPVSGLPADEAAALLAVNACDVMPLLERYLSDARPAVSDAAAVRMRAKNDETTQRAQAASVDASSTFPPPPVVL